MKRTRKNGVSRESAAKRACTSCELLNWIQEMPDIGTHMLFGLMYSDAVDDVNTSVTISLVSKHWNRTWTAVMKRICPHLTSEFRIVCSQVEAFADKLDPRRPMRRLLESYFDMTSSTDKMEIQGELMRMMQAKTTLTPAKTLEMDIPPFNPGMGRGWFESWRNMVLWARVEWDSTYVKDPTVLIVPYQCGDQHGVEAWLRADREFPAFINRLRHMRYNWFCTDGFDLFDWDEVRERDPIRILCESITPHIKMEEGVALMHIIRYTQAMAPPLGPKNPFPETREAQQRKLNAGDMGELLFSMSCDTYTGMSSDENSVTWTLE